MNWPRRLCGVALGVFVVLNFIPYETHHPEWLSGVEDVPGADPRLTEQYYNREFSGVQYGFPFTAYEHWHHRDSPAVEESAVTIGIFGNPFIVVAFLVACRKIRKIAAAFRNQGAPAILILLMCGCVTGPVPDEERHPECYRAARYKVEDLPQMVDRLGDSTLTDTPVYLVGGDCAVGDEAMWAIMEVIPDLPLQSFVPLPHPRDWEGVGVAAYYEYVRADPRNRIASREAVRAWIDAATPARRSTWGTRKWIPIDGY